MRSFNHIAIAGLASALMLQTPVTQAQTRVWGTFYGSEPQSDSVSAVVTTGSGDVYVVGKTRNTSGIATAGAFDTSKAKFDVDSGFIAKLDSNGKRIWGTYYGDEIPNAPDFFKKEAELMDVKLDSSSNVYVLGNIQCPSLGLATPGAFQSQCKGISEVYLAKFSPTGQRLWGTYFGGPAVEQAINMTVTSSGVYIVGRTESSIGIASLNSQDTSNGGGGDGFVAKFALSGARIWSRYYGGAEFDRIFDIACRRSATNQEDCVIVGDTRSPTDIVTPNAHDVDIEEGEKAFIARINGTNGQRLWGTYFGDGGLTWAKSVVVDGNLNIYAGGTTLSHSGLATPGAFMTSAAGFTNNFLVKFDAAGKRIVSTYLGEDFSGSKNELQDLAMDASGNVYAYAFARNQNQAVSQATPNAFDSVRQGDEAVIVKFNPVLQRVWATYYGGSGDELQDFFSGGITIGRDNHVYVVGETTSPDDMATPEAHKPTNSSGDGFIAEFAQ